MILVKISLVLSSFISFHNVVPKAHQLPVTPAMIREWTRVAICETGADWTMVGPIYSGALGISDRNWSTYRLWWMSSNAGHATPRQQIYVASLIDRGYPMPDQNGSCNAW